MRAWMSWCENAVDYRPLTYPPRREVLGWWCTGYNADDMPTIVAMIECDDLNDAAEIVYSEWPMADEWVEEHGWRFAALEPDTFVPPSDRFVIADWMVDRIGVTREEG